MWTVWRRGMQVCGLRQQHVNVRFFQFDLALILPAWGLLRAPLKMWWEEVKKVAHFFSGQFCFNLRNIWEAAFPPFCLVFVGRSPSGVFKRRV